MKSSNNSKALGAVSAPLRAMALVSTSVTAMALFGAPALAQNTTTQPQAASSEEDGPAIVVTGSILRRTDRETVSPVAVLSAETLETRGINTASEGLQRLAANGSGTLSEGWNNGNNFAAGGNAVSLRGLTVQKTLTIFDGLRMAPYPVADDGHRNFVDLNTIPDAIIDRIEVLKDGASSTYGADAVAGVVNVITKKQVVGLHTNLSAGISGRGDGEEYRADVTAGVGDLKEQGFNIYVTGMYRRNEEIWARDRDYPFNTGYLSNICNGAGACMATPTRWYSFGVNADGTLGGSSVPLAPIVAAANTTGTTRLTEYQLLNTNCGEFNSQTQTLPTTARSFNSTTGLYTYATNVCQQDMKKAYQTIRPKTERYGFSVRATARVSDTIEAYVAGNYMFGNTYTQLTPGSFPNQTPPPSIAIWNSVLLPVYVCNAGTASFNAAGVNISSGCTAANGALNPNNPFAAAGQAAFIRARYDLPQTVETNSRALRGAAGIAGTFGAMDDWNFSVDFTASQVKLSRISANYLIPQRLADKIATGEYNFVHPSQNTQAVRDYVAPVNTKTSTSDLWQVNATLSHALFELPGGTVQAAVGVSYRKESINDQSANPENLAHPFERYFTINAVGAVGSRNVKSAFYEINAPLVDTLEVNASGRFDKYSSGQENFSPKFGAKFKPIKEVLLRATWSKGFRIPSFNEAYGLPTTGYTTLTISCTTYAAFCAAHGNNTYATGQYSLGRTSTGNAALSPEKSTSWTLGAVVEPIRGVSFSLDYFNISVKDTIGNISAQDQDAALDAYLKNGTTNAVTGVTVVAANNDPQFPTARALPGFIQFSFTNSDQEKVEGIDFGVEVNKSLSSSLKWVSSFDASYLINYSVVRKNGTVERYDGSLSPCDYTSCSGSPKWRGSWQNSLTYDRFTGTATVYYTDGYDLASVDYGGTPGNCVGSIGKSVVAYKTNPPNTTPVQCTTGAQWNVDLSFNFKLNSKFALYANILNAFNIAPKFDPSAAYSIFQYNPSWGQPNIVGRYFRVGVKADF
jgi:iron complex outermembrane receptor protein